MRNRNSRIFSISIALLMLGGSIAWADDAPSKNAKPAADTTDRQQMIQMHQEMVDFHSKILECLKSDKPLDSCQEQFAAHCQSLRFGHHMPGMWRGEKMHRRMDGRNAAGWACPFRDDVK